LAWHVGPHSPVVWLQAWPAGQFAANMHFGGAVSAATPVSVVVASADASGVESVTIQSKAASPCELPSAPDGPLSPPVPVSTAMVASTQLAHSPWLLSSQPAAPRIAPRSAAAANEQMPTCVPRPMQQGYHPG
jgi:hypothetical protein